MPDSGKTEIENTVDDREENALATSQEPEVLPAPVSDEVIDEVAGKIQHLQRTATLDLAMNVGKIVVEGIYGGDLDQWRARGAKDSSFRKLADREDLGLSRSTLQRSVAIYEMCDRLGVSTWRHLGVSHLRAVLGLPDEHQRRLLTNAEKKEWTVEKTLKEAARYRKSDGRGRKPLPSFVKAITRLDRIVENREALLGDLDKVEEMEPQQATALVQKVNSIRKACEELEEQLRGRVSG